MQTKFQEIVNKEFLEIPYRKSLVRGSFISRWVWRRTNKLSYFIMLYSWLISESLMVSAGVSFSSILGYFQPSWMAIFIFHVS